MFLAPNYVLFHWFMHRNKAFVKWKVAHYCFFCFQYGFAVLAQIYEVPGII